MIKIEAQFRLLSGVGTDLKSILKYVAGDDTIVAQYQYEDDPDKSLIASRGRDWTKISKLYNGPDGKCHWNVAKLYRAGLVDGIAIGYAHNFQGWHQHTWGLIGNSLVETTVDNQINDHWFGAKLTPKQTQILVDRCAKYPPGNGMIRTHRGGAL